MQVPPQGQQAKQQLLQGSAEPDLSNQQHESPQQQQRTGGQGNSGHLILQSRVSGSFETKNPRGALGTPRGKTTSCLLLGFFSQLSIPQLCHYFSWSGTTAVVVIWHERLFLPRVTITPKGTLFSGEATPNTGSREDAAGDRDGKHSSEVFNAVLNGYAVHT
jgi:hypothetical protein